MSKSNRIAANHRLEELERKLNLLLDVVEVTISRPDGETATISVRQLDELSQRLGIEPTRDN